MNRRRLLLMLLPAVLLTGCGGKMKPSEPEPTAHHTVPVTAAEHAADSADSVPAETAAPEETAPPDAEYGSGDPELDRRIEVIFDAEPVPVPEGGWTDETLSGVTLLCGEPLPEKIRISSLLYGYEIISGDAEYYKQYAKSYFTSELIFHGATCSALEVLASEDIPEHTVPHYIALSAKYQVITEDGGYRYPFSVNCVTVGSDYETVKRNLGGTGSCDDSGHFRVLCETEHLRLSLIGDENTVHTIMLRIRESKPVS